MKIRETKEKILKAFEDEEEIKEDKNKEIRCIDCGREISAEEYARNKSKCDRCSIGDFYA